MCSAGAKVVSKLCQGKEISVIWEIKDWKIKDDSDFDRLTKNISYTLDIAGGGTAEDLMRESYNASLRFYFDREETYKAGTDSYGPKHVEAYLWLRLNVDQLSNLGNRIVQYEFKVDLADGKQNVIDPHKSFHTSKDHEAIKKLPLHSNVLYLQESLIKKNDVGWCWDSTVFLRPESVGLKISVTPIYITTSSVAMQRAQESIASREAYLCEAMKNMFTNGEEIYPDIKLETKDNFVLDAHKFMLDARSPFLRKMIDMNVKEDGFNGMIKLEEVNAKPMIAILHWMYTGELHDNIAKFMEEVVDAAIQFELNGMIQILDRKMVTICNQENMFELLQVVKKNKMMNAAAEISKFIKDNLE